MACRLLQLEFLVLFVHGLFLPVMCCSSITVTSASVRQACEARNRLMSDAVHFSTALTQDIRHVLAHPCMSATTEARGGANELKTTVSNTTTAKVSPDLLCLEGACVEELRRSARWHAEFDPQLSASRRITDSALQVDKDVLLSLRREWKLTEEVRDFFVHSTLLLF